MPDSPLLEENVSLKIQEVPISFAVPRLSFAYGVRSSPALLQEFFLTKDFCATLTSILIILACGCNDPAPVSTVDAYRQSDDSMSIVTVHRSPSYNLSAVGMDVYVNDVKLGTVNNGDTKEFAFTPRNDGKNFFYSEIPSIGLKAKSLTNTMLCQADEEISVTTTIGLFSYSLSVEMTKATARNDSVRGTSISFDDKFVERELISEIVETLPGTKRTVKRSRTIEHALTLTDSKALEIDGSVNLVVISGAIRKKLETSLSQTFKQSETVEQSIEIDGRERPAVRLAWVEKYRTGIAKMTINGVEKKIPFEFRENIELRSIPVSR